MKTISAVSNEIYIGKQGENNAVRVIFSLSHLFNIENISEYGFSVINKRPEEEIGYPVPIAVEDDNGVWVISNVDNAVSGFGECQLNCFKGDDLYKSITFRTKIDKSVDGTGDIPEPYENILDRMIEVYTDTVDAKNGAESARDSAVEAKDTANEYAHLAREFSDEAHVYSLNAKDYSNSAKRYSEEAEQSRQYALEAEGSARNYSEIAHGYALTAETQANDAGTYAGQSLQYKNDAVQAKNDAVSAKNDAETAQGLAEDARDDAEDILEIVTSMLPVDSESGNICNITDGANNLPFKSIICGIKPRQSGSGDPSPTNVRSINGWLGTTLTRTGKNTLKFPATAYSEQRCTYTKTDNTVSVDATGTFARASFAIPVKTGETYTFSCIGSGTGDNNAIYLRGLDPWSATAASGNYGTPRVSTNTPVNITFTAISDVLYVGCYVTTSGTTGNMTLTNVQLELGSNATTYEAYRGTNYDVYWGDSAGTVYGGTLDITTGVLTVDTQYFVMDGTTRQVTYTTTASGYRLFLGLAPSPSIVGAGTTAKPYLSDQFIMKYTALPGQAYMSGANGQQITMYFIDQTIDNLDDANAWLAENQPKFVVALANPTTYQLTPTQINTFLGVNNLWCDTGETSAEYTSDIGLYIDKKIANATNNRNLLTAPSPVVEVEDVREEVETRENV